MQAQNSSKPVRTVLSRPETNDVTSEFEYDADGKLVKAFIDEYGKGQTDFIFTYEYDANGNLTKTLYDYDTSGTPNRIDENKYDASGNLIEETYDYTVGDGEINLNHKYEYDANGNQIKAVLDYQGDGIVDRIDQYEYDADGNQTQASFDYDADGTVDESRQFEYKYDAAGNLTEASYDNNNDGTPQAFTQYEYDASGNLIKVSENTDGEGAPEIVTQYEYDVSGNLTRELIDPDDDGISKETTYFYSTDAAPNQPETVEPEVTEPEDSTTENSNPEVVVPEEGVDSEAGSPEVTEPGATDPGDNTPEDSNPEISSPVVDTPDVAAPEVVKSLTISLEDLGINGVGELRVFGFEADGSRTQIGSFSTLERSKLSGADFSSEFSIESNLLTVGSQLQFELEENGNVRTGTLDVQNGLMSTLDLGNNARLLIELDGEAAAPNLLREDATTIDLSGYDGGDVTLNFSVYREASYDSTLGFYRTDAANGAIMDAMTGEMLQAGDDGYQEAAIARQMDMQLSGQNGEVSTFSSTMTGGGFLGMFLISDGSDATSGDLLFSNLGANGGNDHVKMLGNNTFGFEDMVGLGDRDFNDMVVKVEVA